MVGQITSAGINVQLHQTFEADYFNKAYKDFEHVTCRAYKNPLVGVILIDFHMGLGLYRWEYACNGLSPHSNRGFFFHGNINQALHAGVTYFHVFTEGKYRSYNIWWE